MSKEGSILIETFFHKNLINIIKIPTTDGGAGWPKEVQFGGGEGQTDTLPAL